MALDYIEPGTNITGFAIHTPIDDEICRAQVAANLRRDLPDAVSRRKLTVIANGPSARGIDLFNVDTPTLAVNGAIKLFTDWGLAPTYWACCDPQALVADFLPDKPPARTIYYVASKCHASVFEKLKGYDVRVWHLPDYRAEGKAHEVQACSVTISASWLLIRAEGFTDLDYWGWDGCLMGKHHHATGENAELSDTVELTCTTTKNEKVIDTRVFITTRAWAAENHGAEYFFQLAIYFDINVTLHGDGMFKYFQQPYMKANLALEMAA